MKKDYKIGASKLDSYSIKYFTIEVLESNNDKIYLKRNDVISDTSSCTIQYSKNGGAWTSITATVNTDAEIPVNTGDIIKFKGTNITYKCWNFYFTFPSNVKGNIMSLFYADNFYKNNEFPEFTNPDLDPDLFTNDFVLARLFKNCNNIKSAEHLILPANNLYMDCYYDMFFGCTSLETAPKLPATQLDSGCYSGMFENCTSLKTAPELSATILASNCYSSMFFGCTSLINPPELPATTLAQGCYRAMFENCTSLKSVPNLPAVTLYTECYYEMFEGCTSLENVPNNLLPATTLTDRCYSGMFEDCTSLLNAPILPATTLTNGCYASMFRGCYLLKETPYLPATTLAQSCYAYMFYDCHSLEKISSISALYFPPSSILYMFHSPKGDTRTYSYIYPDTWRPQSEYIWRLPKTGTGTLDNAPLENQLQRVFGWGGSDSDPMTIALNTDYNLKMCKKDSLGQQVELWTIEIKDA